LELRIAGIVKESVVNGPGLRFVVFVQGCRHRCQGCHNPETWDPAGGVAVRAGDLLEQIKSVKLLKGVTFSGGEPVLQAGPLAWLAREARKLGLDVIIYTGYTWEGLLALARQEPAVEELIRVSDYIVDGPFILTERDPELPFRGSRNQRIIDVARSLREGTVIEAGFS